MSILKSIREDTIQRLERASKQRLKEAEYLGRGSFYLAGIYLCGYAAEMTLGASYFRAKGYGVLDPISVDDRKRVVAGAKQRRLMDRFNAHDIKGWASLLIEDLAELYRRPLDPRTERRIRDDSTLIADHWSPKLRYRNIQTDAPEFRRVADAADRLIRVLSP